MSPTPTRQSRKARSINLRPTFAPISPAERERAAQLPRLGVPATSSPLLKAVR